MTAEPIGMAEMNRIFAVTDELEISRESIQVPLLPEGEGAARRLPGGRIEITVPATRPFDEWLADLPRRLADLGD